jgi:glycine cleavage system H protein
MEFPATLRYSREHEWARVEGDEVVIGISDFAQDALGDVVYIALPEIGARVEADGQCGEIESTKSVSEVYAPVAGTVVAVNEALADRPELVNSDPYGDGWIARLQIVDAAQLDALMDAAAYQAFVEG